MISEETRQLFATVEMEPVDLTRLRATKGSDVWETVRGKRNRIAIGAPRCLLEEQPAEGGMLTAEDLNEFRAEKHSFYRLNLTLTLLPDEGCRFQKADFIIDFSKTVGDLPIILRLRPAKHTSRKLVVDEENEKLKLSFQEPILKLIGAELDESRVRREEIEQIIVSLESFGVRTKQSGWRFRLTNSQEIPLSTTDLEALIVMPRNIRTTAQFRIVAAIDVLSTVDKWLSWAFKRKEEPTVDLLYEIPKNL
jgi:hypothetical protein